MHFLPPPSLPDFVKLDERRLPWIRLPNPTRQGRKVKKRRSLLSPGKRNSAFLCAPRSQICGAAWETNSCDPWLFQEERSFSFSLLPFHRFSSLCATSGVYRIRDAAPPGPESRDIAEIDPRARARARVRNRARRLCNVFIFFLPLCISDNVSKQQIEITLQVYHKTENVSLVSNWA